MKDLTAKEALLIATEAKKTFRSGGVLRNIAHVLQNVEKAAKEGKFYWSQRLPSEEGGFDEVAIKDLEAKGFKIEKKQNQWIGISWNVVSDL